MTLKIHSTEAERLAEYRICQERGHVPSQDEYYYLLGKWHVCKFCGTRYMAENIVHESNKPEGAE